MANLVQSAGFAAIVATSAALVSGGDVHAAEVTITAVKDNTIFSGGTNSNGAGPNIFSGRTGASGGNTIQRGLFQFDVAAAVPAGSTITAVEVTLTLIQAGPFSGSQTHALHRVLSDWGEGASQAFGGSGTAAADGDATWEHMFFPGSFWGSSGGDFMVLSSATQTVTQAPGPFTWGTSPLLVNDVQLWLNAPGSNFGWMVRGNEVDTFTAKKFASRTNTPCSADITGPQGLGIGDGNVDSLDFLGLIGQWGTPCVPGPFCEADITGPEKSPDGNVDALDYLLMISQWGTPGNCISETDAPKLTITYTAP